MCSVHDGHFICKLSADISLSAILIFSSRLQQLFSEICKIWPADIDGSSAFTPQIEIFMYKFKSRFLFLRNFIVTEILHHRFLGFKHFLAAKVGQRRL